MSYRARERIVTHSLERIEVEAQVSFDELRARFEELVPTVDSDEIAALVARNAPWDEIARLAGRPLYGFMRYPAVDVSPLMRLSGIDIPSATYQLTNHSLLARMFRHDAGVLLYAPLVAELHEPTSGVTIFAIDRPGSHFASFGNNKIAQVGAELDRALGDLLEALDLPRPSVLRR